jgi:hypothetical protein
VPHRYIDKPFDFCESDDIIYLPVDLFLAQSEDRAVQIDVLPTRQIGMKTGSQL